VIKYVLTFFVLTALAATAMAQEKSVINLIKSESVEGIKINGVSVLKVYKGVFQQKYSTLQSDSAYIYQAQNTFDAFGHVVITQGDTLHIYSDKLNYNDNTKIAILTENVKMVDKDATLTTNYLTYNTATKYGTYINGGKLVNKDNILTSKNGYYFANSRDAFFRYNVNLTTPDAFVVTDTLRYNSNSKIAYFYGPTNIYGKKKTKDNDTLYTENGTYNTNTEQALFGKKNLYKSGSKSLKGDSLQYDRKKGIGHAINHITFTDTQEKMILKGDIGDYTKADERTIVTKNAYVVMVTEEKDTTKNDSLKKAGTDTTKAASDTVNSKQVEVKPPGSKAVDKTGKNKDKNAGAAAVQAPPAKVPTDTAAVKTGKKNKAALNLPKLPVDTIPTKKDTGRLKHDSIYMTADTLDTKVMTYKDYKVMQEKIRLSHIIDTNAKAPSIVYKKPVKYIELSPPKMLPDTTFLHRNFFGPPKKKDIAEKKPGKNAPPAKKLSKQDSVKQARLDSIKNVNKVDSVYLTHKVELSDTAHIRILSAFHHVKLFKSDLQGKSDSAFYSSGDSVIHLYVHPILWTQGSQLSGDTITLQMKNKKLNNMELFPNGFIVNIEKKDSVNFNQVAGKKMRGFFKDDKLTSMFIDGNSETIYFAHDSTGKVTEMHRSLSSRIRVRFKDNKVSNVTFLAKPEHRYGPLSKFTEDEKLLKGFIWKPKERPVSKEVIIHPVDNYPAKKAVKDKTPAANAGKKTAGKKGNNKTGQNKDSAPVNLVTPADKTAKDSLQKPLPGKTQDSVKKTIDTTAVKKARDTTTVKKGKDTTLVKKPVNR